MFEGLFKVAVASTLATGAAYAQSAPAGSPTEPAAAPAASADDAAALAQKLSNPVSSLISVPFQFNYDARIGPLKDGERLTINVQPVIPFSISKDWNLVSRTIVPIVWQSDIFPGSGNQFGLGDTVQSFFFTPKQAKGIIWGAGPVILLPTGTDQLLSGHKWGVGPTAVVLKQAGQPDLFQSVHQPHFENGVHRRRVGRPDLRLENRQASHAGEPDGVAAGQGQQATAQPRRRTTLLCRHDRCFSPWSRSALVHHSALPGQMRST